MGFWTTLLFAPLTSMQRRADRCTDTSAHAYLEERHIMPWTNKNLNLSVSVNNKVGQ